VGFEIGDTIADYENPEALKSLQLMSLQWACCLRLMILLSLVKKEIVTSRHIRDRLTKELEKI
jgi:GTP-binding protein